MQNTFLLLLLLTLLLSGCASVFGPAVKPFLSGKLQQQRLYAQESWDMMGVIGIHTATTGSSATFDWQQRVRTYSIQLYGPLGAGHVELTGSPHHITLKTADEKTYSARNPEALIHQQLGWQLPVTNLYYWVRGLPAPHTLATTQFDDKKRMSELIQQGWHIHYDDYTTVNALELPRRITLDNGAVHIRIVINQWRLP